MFKRWKKRFHTQQPDPNSNPSPPAKGFAGKRSSPRSLAERARLLALHAKSTLSQAEFCAEHGIKLDTFRVWIRRAMAAVDTRYAKRYSPEERRVAVEAYLKSGRTRGDFVRLWGCSPSSLDKG